MKLLMITHKSLYFFQRNPFFLLTRIFGHFNRVRLPLLQNHFRLTPRRLSDFSSHSHFFRVRR
ncbi:uncharacterized protein DS421_9g268320 [Arachis hypogaea]|nr:uncharacterized protein DS421_9g268320 [Arachis hypogaea]